MFSTTFFKEKSHHSGFQVLDSLMVDRHSTNYYYRHTALSKAAVIKHSTYTIDNTSGSLSFDQRLQDSQ